MTYEAARSYVDSTKQYGSILGLTNIRNLMARLDDVQDSLHIIHIAGTNGKGSTGAMIASALMEAGRSVGRYSSPAVFHYREIYQLDGCDITKEDYTRYVARVKLACEALVRDGQPHPTSFEVETAVAFLFFYEKKCDDVILEVGMGGTTDATNLIARPACSVLTSISMDHMMYLGDTLAQIAGVKAGIIKEGCAVVTAPQHAEVMDVIRRVAQEKRAPLLVADRSALTQVKNHIDGTELGHRELGRICLKLGGTYQADNASCAITVLQYLQREIPALTDEHIVSGLEKAVWSGRFELICREPMLFLDGAHNEAAAIQLRRTIDTLFPGRELIYMMGVLADKEYEKILRIMSGPASTIYVVESDNPRALAADKLKEVAEHYYSDARRVGTIEQTTEYLLDNAGADEIILAFGSLSYLGIVRETCTCRQNTQERQQGDQHEASTF